MTASARLAIESRKLDLLWVGLSIGMALFTWLYAVREAYAPIWLYILLHIQCAAIFALRHQARISSKRPLEILVTLFSLTYIFAFDPVPIASSAHAAVGGTVSAIGGLLAIASVQCLGRSFAVLPSLRFIQTSGMYRFVRHPIYLSYIVMALGVLIRHPTLYNALVAMVGVVLLVGRIGFEERLLKEDETYRAYMDAVRYRLIPGVY